jgi:L-cystine transport system permease protein
MGFAFDPSFFIVELGVALRFVPITLLLSFVPLAAGAVLGFLLASARLFRLPFLAQASEAFSTLVRGIPIVLLLTILYLLASGLPNPMGNSAGSLKASYLLTALTGLSLSAAVNLGGSFYSAFRAVDKGQLEAGLAAGLTRRQALFRLILPQSLPVAIPMLANNLIGLIKSSSVASLICVVEIVAGTQMRAVENYKFLEAYFAAALVYWALCSGIEAVGKALEKKTGIRKEDR